MKRLVLPLLPGMFALLAAGCLGTAAAQRKAAAQRRAFTPVVAAPAERLAPQPRFAEARMRSVRALPPFDSRAFLVRRSGGEMALDYYNGWIAPPQELVRVEAARYLERTGLFAALYDAGVGTAATLGVEGVLSELFLDYASDPPAAVATLRLLVLDERTAGFAVRFNAERTGRVTFAAGEPAAPASALGAALTQTLEALAAALAAADLPAP